MLYAAQLGWVQSTVKIASGRDKQESITKGQRFGADSLICKLPDCGKAQYIVEHWFSCGQVSSNGFGVSALDWKEINSYMEVAEISKWESMLVQLMSRVYTESKRKFEDVMCEPPYKFEGKDVVELMITTVGKIEKPPC